MVYLLLSPSKFHVYCHHDGYSIPFTLLEHLNCDIDAMTTTDRKQMINNKPKFSTTAIGIGSIFM